jgi:hypothetical protein
VSHVLPSQVQVLLSDTLLKSSSSAPPLQGLYKEYKQIMNR